MTVPARATTVVLDLGNVLVTWDPAAAFVGSLTPEETAEFFAAVDFPRLNQLQDAGRPWAAARADVSARSPHLATLLDVYLENFACTLTGPVPGVAELALELRDAGVRLLGLTNWSAETYHHAVPAAPAIGLLEDVLVSGRVGLAKPDPQIFRLLARSYGLEPARTVFVDDAPANVAAADAEGYDAILFTDATALRTALVARGLLR